MPSCTGVRCIRPATDADVDALVRLERELFSDARSAESVRRFVTPGQGAAWSDAWVAERGGEVCGYLLASSVLDEATIERVGVRECQRRRGIGRALIERCAVSCASRGVRTVWLEVGESNHPARRLYEETGFVVVSRRRRYYTIPSPDHDQPPTCEDAIVMMRTVGEQC